MTVRIELELDMEAYNQKYGPGSEHWAEYCKDRDPAEHLKPGWLEEVIHEILEEGFYDWSSQGWMKVQVQQS